MVVTLWLHSLLWKFHGKTIKLACRVLTVVQQLRLLDICWEPQVPVEDSGCSNSLELF